MKFEAFYPRQKILKDTIEYYYFQKTNSDNFSTEYYAFPNIVVPLNIHRNINCQIDGHQSNVIGIKQKNYVMILNGRYEIPLHVQQKGKIDKVTIIFKPLGLNCFIKVPFIEVAQKPTQIFTEWTKTNNAKTFFEQFFGEQDNDKRILILEDYLLSLYTPFSESPFLSDILNMLNDFNKEVSIEDIAKKFSLSSRTLDRLFKKHLGVSPVSFRKVARFRHSLKNKLFNDQFDTLTRIGYESNFYDQSYFIKVYKNLTGQNPKAFFNSIDKLADNKLLFKFIKSEIV
ncbi:MAG: helix-turn-helix transcriptional regulator [Bacteroidetes bacterium]|nr:helix-turn-helix transcriptional regulator [Bacteroidota bacterium]